MKRFFQTFIADKFNFGFGKTIASQVKMGVNVKVELFGANGKCKMKREVHNTVTNPGLYGLMDQLLAAPSLAKAGWMEVGTGTGGTTTLNAYIASSRTALSTIIRNNAAVSFPCTFAAGVGTGAITEAGVFGVVTQNTAPMWLYATFAVVNKGALDSLTITWTFTASA